LRKNLREISSLWLTDVIKSAANCMDEYGITLVNYVRNIGLHAGILIFTALHGMQTRSSDENSVCPSVCLSVTRVHCDKTVERSVQIFIPYERTFSLVFWEKNSWWGATPSTWNFGSTGPSWSKIGDFQPIIARSAPAVTSGEKSSINANRKSTTRFPMSLRWSSYVVPKPSKWGSKTQNGRFPAKIALRLKKVCYKVSLCENYQQQSCKAFIGLTNRANIIGGGDPFYVKFWIKVTALELVATQP